MTKTVVIVEDEPLLLKALNLQLQSMDLKIYCANSGESALPLIKKVLPDLVLMDLILPKLSGFDIIKMLKSNKKTDKIPVIVMSNLDQKDELKHVNNPSIVGYFVKADTDLKTIAEKVSSFLKIKQQ